MKDFENLSERDALILLLRGIANDNKSLMEDMVDERNTQVDRDIAKRIFDRNRRASKEITERLKEVEV